MKFQRISKQWDWLDSVTDKQQDWMEESAQTGSAGEKYIESRGIITI